MAIEHLEKSLAINKEIGDRNKEGDCYITLELCINQLVNMTRRGNHSRNHLRSKTKSVIGMDKAPVTEFLELYINQLANVKRDRTSCEITLNHKGKR